MWLGLKLHLRQPHSTSKSTPNVTQPTLLCLPQATVTTVSLSASAISFPVFGYNFFSHHSTSVRRSKVWSSFHNLGTFPRRSIYAFSSSRTTSLRSFSLPPKGIAKSRSTATTQAHHGAYCQCPTEHLSRSFTTAHIMPPFSSDFNDG